MAGSCGPESAAFADFARRPGKPAPQRYSPSFVPGPAAAPASCAATGSPVAEARRSLKTQQHAHRRPALGLRICSSPIRSARQRAERV